MRIVSGMIFAAVVGLTAGCGGPTSSQSGEQKTALADDSNKPAPSPQSQPAAPPQDTPEKPTPPPSPPASSPTAGWEMDTARHVIPNVPVAGKVAGESFAPEASLFDQILAFRILKPGAPQRMIEVTLTPDLWKDPAGFRIVIKPDQKEGPEVPRVALGTEPTTPDPSSSLKLTYYPMGYALTLEMKKQEKNRYLGRICLAIPDDAKSFLVGEFTVSRIRSPETPPGPDDAPFVQGKLTVTGGSATPQIQVGYVGAGPNEQFIQGQLDLQFSGKNLSTFYDFGEGRVTSLAGPTDNATHGRYEHTRLHPTRYLVYGRLAGGPTVWKWLTVEPNSQLTEDFALDASKFGKLSVVVPAGFAGDVRLAPVDDPSKPLPVGLFVASSVVLGLDAKPKDGAATFENLGPGRYEVRAGDAGDLTATVEIKPGSNEKVELKKK